jgi:hypothetical protein
LAQLEAFVEVDMGYGLLGTLMAIFGLLVGRGQGDTSVALLGRDLEGT